MKREVNIHTLKHKLQLLEHYLVCNGLLNSTAEQKMVEIFEETIKLQKVKMICFGENMKIDFEGVLEEKSIKPYFTLPVIDKKEFKVDVENKDISSINEIEKKFISWLHQNHRTSI